MDRVPVTTLIYHYSKMTVPTLPPVWSSDPQAKFNIFAAVSEAAHRMRGMQYRPQNAAAAAEDTTVVTATPPAAE